jgi:hypothetical protein
MLLLLLLLFKKNREQMGRTSPVWDVGTSGSGKDVRKESRR